MTTIDDLIQVLRERGQYLLNSRSTWEAYEESVQKKMLATEYEWLASTLDKEKNGNSNGEKTNSLVPSEGKSEG